MNDSHSTEVAIVGGGPAGAALAIRMARLGRETVLFERRTNPEWRACGVFSTPLTRRHLADLGLSADDLATLIRPISRLSLTTTRGSRCLLEYEDPFACGIDRVTLDQRLLELASSSGAQVRSGAVVTRVDLASRHGDVNRIAVADTAAGEGGVADPPATWRAKVVVGADGPRSIVARAAGVDRPPRFLRRAGITYHLPAIAGNRPDAPSSGGFLFGNGWYVGIAPVPDDRVNVGIVVTEQKLRSRLARDSSGMGIRSLARELLDNFPRSDMAWQSSEPIDEPAVALPLAHRAGRAGGHGFLLVGDAAGFVDPLSGEGIHRALISSAHAAHAALRMLSGDTAAAADYDRRLRARFRNKDLVSWLLQAFLARPELLDYGLRRLGSRHGLRRTLTSVLADQAPASRALDPRFLAGVLRP